MNSRSRGIRGFHSKQRQRLIWMFAVTLTSIAVHKICYASDWSFNTSTNLQLEYNDNKRLEVGPHDTVFGSILNVQSELKRQTETTNYSLTPRYRVDRFKGSEGLNSETAYVDTSLSHTTQKSVSQLAIGYTRDTPLTSELQQTEIVLTNKIRNRLSVSPFWSYQLNERNTINFGAAHLNVRHEDAALTGLVDYKYTSAFSQYSVLLSENSKLGLKLYGSRLDAKQVKYTTDDGGVELSLDSQFTQTDKYSVRFGWHQVTLGSGPDNARIRDTQEGTLIGVNYENRFERGNLVFNIENTIEPSGVGVLVETRKGSISFKRQLSETVGNIISVSSSNTKSVADRGTYNKWESRQLLWRVVIKLNKYWAFDSLYRFAWQKVSNTRNAAQSNAIIFTLSYVDH